MITDSSCGIERSAWKEISEPSAYSSSSSVTTLDIQSGWRISSMSVQAEVPEEVWWPAKSIEMKTPVM